MSKDHNISNTKPSNGSISPQDVSFAMSEECFQGLYETIADGIAYTDLRGNILKANPAFCEMLGYAPEDMVGKTMLDLTPPDDRSAERELIMSIMDGTARSTDIEKRYIHSEGRLIPVQVRFWVNKDSEGRTIGLWGVIKDLTNQKAAEELAARTQEQYRFVADNSEDIIWAVDQSLAYTYISPSVERIRGFTPEEVMSTSFENSMTEESYAKVLDAIARGLDASKAGNKEIVDRLELELKCKDGGTVWVESVAKAMLSEQNEWIGIVGSTRDISERKTVEQKLMKSETSLQALINATDDFVGLFNIDGEILVMNSSPIRTIWDKFQGDIGSNVFDVIPEEGRPELRSLINDILKTQKPVQGEIVWFGRILDYTLYPIHDENGKIWAFASYVVDMTEEHHAEEEHKRTQEQYRLIVENAQESIVGMDADQHITYVNPVFADLVGYDVSEIIGRPMTNFLASDELENNRKRIAQRREGHRARYDCKFLRKDGTEVWGMVSASPLMAEDRSYLGVFAMVADITEVKQAHERLLTILDGMDADIYVSDLDTNEILFMNAHMRREFGAYEQGMTCHELFYEYDEQCPFCPKPELWDDAGNLHDTVITERFNKRLKRWFLNHDRTIEWLSGKVVHMHMAADITTLKTMSEDLKVAIVEAKAASLAKNEFLANMSHEIRTPLNGLLGMLQLLQHSSLELSQKESLDTALGSGRNLLQILNDILDISKVESGKLELEEQPFELDEVLDSAVSIFRPVVEERGIGMSWKIDRSLPIRFEADKGRLRQILFNLVGNASKFTDEGFISVEAYPVQSTLDSERPLVFFRVKDTGIGIPDNKIADVFDPFTQADGSITRKYQGTGLGLGIVHRLVQLMGGTITVSSEVGRGTTIAFTIRARMISQDREKHESVVAEIRRSENLSILVAEDERVNQLVVQRLLQKLGHNVRCVDSGEDALSTLKTEIFDLFLTDIQMPGLDGVETTRILREERKMELPIVALTAHAMKGDQERYLAAGMNGYVAKPFELEELRDEIDRVMAESSEEKS